MNEQSLIGSKLGKYQIQAEIGRGGMGAVYKGYDPSLDRHVAIKVLAPHLVWQEGFVERFLREARAAARLQHPNIVTIYDVGQQAGIYYYVMEYLEGQTLTELTEQQGSFAPEGVLAILRPLGGALDYAHHNGLVHRDIKPANIIVGRPGRVSLTDFGIARAVQETRLTATGMTVGTPEYMSPEQVQGLVVDARCDQYSLAVVAYEMLSGKVPFEADSTLALMYKVVHDPPPPIREVRPELPVQVEQVLAKALAKEPGGRYPTVTAFIEALEGALSGRRARGVRAIPVAPVKKASTRAAQAEAAAPKGPRTAAPVPTARPARPVAPARERRGLPWWIWLLAGATVLFLVVALAMALNGRGGEATPTAVAGIVTQVVTSAPAEPSPTSPVTVAPSPSAPPTEAPTTAPPSASPSPRPTDTQVPNTPTRTPTSTPSATAVPTSAPTATRTAPPTPRPTSPPPTATRVAQGFPAPNLLAPDDGQAFVPGDEIVLQWQSVGDLPTDGFYEIVVTYSPASDPSQTWHDETPWVKETRWTLSEHDYLPNLSADGEFRWSVRVMHKTGEDQGKPTGTALSPMSPVRTLTWRATAEGGGDGGNGGNGPPEPPPPEPPPPEPPPPP